MFTSHDIVTSIQLWTNLSVCAFENRHDIKNMIVTLVSSSVRTIVASPDFEKGCHTSCKDKMLHAVYNLPGTFLVKPLFQQHKYRVLNSTNHTFTKMDSNMHSK